MKLREDMNAIELADFAVKLAEFQKTRTESTIGAANGDFGDEIGEADEPIFVYYAFGHRGFIYATPLENGNYWTIIENSEPQGTQEEVEAALLEWMM